MDRIVRQQRVIYWPNFVTRRKRRWWRKRTSSFFCAI